MLTEVPEITDELLIIAFLFLQNTQIELMLHFELMKENQLRRFKMYFFVKRMNNITMIGRLCKSNAYFIKPFG